MSGINVDIKIYKGSTEIEFISFRTSIQLCTGVGNLEFEIPIKSVSFNPYDEITVYQNGIKSGVYYVVEVIHNYDSGTSTIHCQDGSKKLADYFVIDTTSYESPTTTRFHLERILNEVGISYNIQTSSVGSVLPPGAMLGQSSAYDLVNQLVQQSGWYFYFDNNGIMQIFAFPDNENPVGTIHDEDEILSLSTQKNSEFLRNKAVVWGNVDPETSSPVIATAEKVTGYEMTYKDIRPIVVSSPYIYYTSDAVRIANHLLGTFAKIDETVTVSVAGFYPQYNPKNVIYVDSRYWSGNGIITSKSVEFSNGGAITTFVLNEKCPRLTAFYYYGGYVYVGTRNNGVWRKPIRWNHVWESFNAGISTEDYEITDLKIRNGIFACIANKKVYVRGRGSSSWIKYNVPIFVDEDTQEESNPENVVPTSVSINPSTYKIEAIFTDCVKHISWVVTISSGGVTEETQKIKDINNVSLRGISIGHQNDNKIISAIKPHNFDDFKFDYPSSGYLAYANNSVGFAHNKKIFYPKFDFNRKYKIWLEVYDMETDTLTEIAPLLNEYKDDAGGIVSQKYIRRELNFIFVGVMLQDYYNSLKKTLLEICIDIDSLYVVSITPFATVYDSSVDIYLYKPRFNGRLIGISNYYNRTEKTLSLTLSNITNYDYRAKNSVTFTHYVGGNPGIGNPPEFVLVSYRDAIDYGVYYFRSNGIWGSSVLALLVVIWYDGTTFNYDSEILSWLGSDAFFPIIEISQGVKVSFIKDITTNAWYVQDLNSYDYEEYAGLSLPIFPQRYCLKSLQSVYFVQGEDSYKDFVLQADVYKYKYIIDDNKFVDIGFNSSVPYQITINGNRYNIQKTANCPNLLRDERVDNYVDGGVLFVDNYAIFPSTLEHIDQYGSSGGYIVTYLDKSSGKYKIIGYTTGATNLEISQTDVILTYPVPSSSYIMSGIFPSGIFNPLYNGNYGILSDLRYAFTTDYGYLLPVVSGSVVLSISGYPVDARSYYEISSGNNLALHVFAPTTLLQEGSTLLSVYQDAGYFQTSISGVVESGIVSRVESFSTLNYPYLFISVSGTDRVRFYQRDGNDVELQTFADRTNNLPNDWINVIRADEVI